jgi:hypothetical protein
MFIKTHSSLLDKIPSNQRKYIVGMDLEEFKRKVRGIGADQARRTAEESAIIADAAERADALLGAWGSRGDVALVFQTGHYAVPPVDMRAKEGPVPKYATYRIEDGRLNNDAGLPVDSSVEIATQFIKDSDALADALASKIDNLRRSGGL